MTKCLVDYWQLLTHADKELLIFLLQRADPKKYGNIQLGSLALVDLKTVRHIVRHKSRDCFPPHSVWTGIVPEWQYLNNNSYNRKLTATRKSLRKHLSPELLQSYNEQRARREKHERKLADRRNRKSVAHWAVNR